MRTLKEVQNKTVRPASQTGNIDIKQLPHELVEQLSSVDRSTLINDEILDWAQDHGEVFNTDDALIALWQIKEKVYEKKSIAARLHKMAYAGQLIKPAPGRFKFNNK